MSTDVIETLPRWEIPSDWQWVSIADVGKVITGNTPPTKDESSYGDHIPFVKPPTLVDGGIRTTPEGLSESGAQLSRTLPVGAVLVSCIGGLGKTGIAKVPVAFNQQINAIVFDERVVPEFGFYYAQTLKQWLHGVASATTLPIVNKGKFQRAPFPLAPLDQQKRIVAEIEKQFSRLDEAVANLKRVKGNLKRYKAAVLKAAVEGRMVETEAEIARREGRSYETGEQLLQRILETRRSQWQGKGKYKEPVAPDTTGLPELPEGWVWTNFDHVTARITKGSSPNWQGFDYCQEGIPFVRSQNVGWGVTDLSDIAYLPPGFNDVEKKSVLQEGDVLLNIVGASIGRAAIAPNDVEGGNVNQAVAVIRLLALAVSNQFVLLYLLSAQTQRRIHSEKVDVARANFSLEDIRVMPFALPPSVEQDRIVAEVDRHLSIIRETEAQVDASLKRAERMRQSILSRAFSGKWSE